MRWPLPIFAYTASWTPTSPTSSQSAGQGYQNIQDLKRDTKERVEGVIDISGTRTFDTDPPFVAADKIDTVSLSKGAGTWTAVARAVTYFGEAVLTTDYTHTGAPNYTTYESITGLAVTVPGTVLMASGIEHSLGTAAGTTDYAIIIDVGLLVSMAGGGSGDYTLFKVRNTTNGVDLGWAGSAIIVRSLTQSQIGTSGGNQRQWLSWKVRDAGRTAETIYQVQFARNVDAGSGITVEGADSAAYITATVFKR